MLNHIINSFSLAAACLSCFTGKPNGEFLAKKWLASIHLSVEEQQKRNGIPYGTRNDLNEQSNNLAYKDTGSVAYKNRLKQRSRFVNLVVGENSKIFDTELVVLELPLSGEMMSNNFFLIYKNNNKLYVNKYAFNEENWHLVSRIGVSKLKTVELITARRCYNKGSNTDPMNVVVFRNHGNTVSAQHYPPNSYCGDLSNFYSM